MNQLIKRSILTNLVTVAAGAAGTSAITSSKMDLKGLEGALIIVAVGPVVAGAVTSFKLQHGDQSGGGDMADILGSNQAIADTDDNTLVYAEVRKPTKRYLQVVFSRATQNATVAVVGIGYGSRDCPTAQPAGVVGEVYAPPSSGTA